MPVEEEQDPEAPHPSPLTPHILSCLSTLSSPLHLWLCLSLPGLHGPASPGRLSLSSLSPPPSPALPLLSLALHRPLRAPSAWLVSPHQSLVPSHSGSSLRYPPSFLSVPRVFAAVAAAGEPGFPLRPPRPPPAQPSPPNASLSETVKCCKQTQFFQIKSLVHLRNVGVPGWVGGGPVGRREGKGWSRVAGGGATWPAGHRHGLAWVDPSTTRPPGDPVARWHTPTHGHRHHHCTPGFQANKCILSASSHFWVIYLSLVIGRRREVGQVVGAGRRVATSTPGHNLCHNPSWEKRRLFRSRLFTFEAT